MESKRLYSTTTELKRSIIEIKKVLTLTPTHVAIIKLVYSSFSK